MKNYKLSDETKTLPCGTVLHRVVATTTFTLACGLIITEGDIGGWIEKESNLSGNAWVHRNAQVYGNAHVFGNAHVSNNTQVYGDAWVAGKALVRGNAHVSGNAKVAGDAHVSGNATVYDNAHVSGDALVCGDAQIYGNAEVSGGAKISGDAKIMNASDYIVFKNSWSSGIYFTWTKSNDMWAVGGFYGTGDELIKSTYAASEASRKHYEVYVNLVETLKNME